MKERVNSLPADKNVEKLKMNSILYANLNVAQIMEFAFDGVKNIAGKVEHAGY